VHAVKLPTAGVVFCWFIATLAGIGVGLIQAGPLSHPTGRAGLTLTAGTRLALPVLTTRPGDDVIVQVQNVGDRPTQAALFAWDTATDCQTAPGPIFMECSGLILPGSVWTWAHERIPDGVASGMVYAFAPSLTACQAAGTGPIAWRNWVTQYGNSGQPLAVSVLRATPAYPSLVVNAVAAYNGITEEVPSQMDRGGFFRYYTPLLSADADGFSSVLYIQNTGDVCTEVTLRFRAGNSCTLLKTVGPLQLAPGETQPFDLTRLVPNGFQGGGEIEATQPLAIVVENRGQDVLAAYEAVPARPANPRLVNHAPLAFSSDEGWQTTVAVQNLSRTMSATVEVAFLDHRGGVLATQHGSICPQGMRLFTRPVNRVGSGESAGAVRVESQVTWPSNQPPADIPYIETVLFQTHYTDVARSEAQEAFAYNTFSAPVGNPGTSLVLPGLARQNADGHTTAIALRNLNSSPGETWVRIDFIDTSNQTNSVDLVLDAGKQVYLTLDALNQIPLGFSGAGWITVKETHQAGDAAIGAVGLIRKENFSGGEVPGDELAVYSAIPVFQSHIPPLTIPTPQPRAAINGVGPRLVLPALNVAGESPQQDVAAHVQVQNVSPQAVVAVMEVYSRPTLACPPLGSGPIRTLCSDRLEPGQPWTFDLPDVDQGGVSAVVSSVEPGSQPIACSGDGTRQRFGALAGVVWRTGLSVPSLAAKIQAAYSAAAEATSPEAVGQTYVYYAPRTETQFGSTSWLNIQNAGWTCTQIDLYFRPDAQCQNALFYSIPSLAPGESVLLDLSTWVGTPISGSVELRSSQPLAMTVDQTGNDQLNSYRVLPALPTNAGSLVNLSPIVYRPEQGWDTLVDVQNLSANADAQVQVDFLDQNGQVLKSETGTICPKGTRSFLWAANDFKPGLEIASVRVESRPWWLPDPPPADLPAIQSVVTGKRYGEAGRMKVLESFSTLALPVEPLVIAAPIALPLIWQGHAGVTTGIAIYNFNPKPGQTQVRIDFRSPGSGQVVATSRRVINPGQVVALSPAQADGLPADFSGSAIITPEFSTQTGGPMLVAGAVLRVSAPDLSGDATFAYLGLPIYPPPPEATIRGRVHLQGRPAPPAPSWRIPLSFALNRPGRSTPTAIFTPTTDIQGVFTVTGIVPGVYDLRIKNAHTLRNVQPNVTLTDGLNEIDLGTLLEGDADDNNVINITDFSILRTTYGRQRGQPGFDARADFNEDGVIDLADFSLLRTNFGK